jgi:hypothetical protein
MLAYQIMANRLGFGPCGIVLVSHEGEKMHTSMHKIQKRTCTGRR